MRVYPPQGQQFGTSPQMHQYNPPHRGGPNGNYKQNYQQNGPHPSSGQQNQVPPRPAPDADEAK